jgi:uncharacterized membrane protein
LSTSQFSDFSRVGYGSEADIPDGVEHVCFSPVNRSGIASPSVPVVALPVAVVAITFVSTRPDAEIATRISAEVPVIWAIMVGTSCVAIARRLGTCLTIPPLSVTGVLDGSDII